MFRTLFLLVTFGVISLGQPRATIVSGDYRAQPLLVAPGQVIPLTVHGLSGPVQDAFAESTPLPRRLAGFEVKLNRYGSDPVPLPILAVLGRSTCPEAWAYTPCQPEPLATITVQLPYTLPFSDGGNSIFIPCCDAVLTIYENGTRRGDVRVAPGPDQVRLMSRCDTALPYSSRVPVGYFGDSCQAPVFDAQGKQLDMGNLAGGGDILTVYAWGLGRVDPKIPTADSIMEGEAPRRPLAVAGAFVVRYEFAANAAVGPGPKPPGLASEGYTWAGLIPGSVGLHQINLRVPPVPSGTPRCDDPINSYETVLSNLTITIRGLTSFDGVRICVESD